MDEEAGDNALLPSDDDVPENRLQGWRLLDRMFSADDWQEHGNHGLALRILQRYPDLSSKMYQDEMGVPATALRRLVCAGITIDVVKEVFSMYPGAVIQEKFEFYDGLLHDACMKEDYDKVVDFLVDQYPTALQEVNAQGRLPIHSLMAKPGVPTTASIPNIKKILELCPDTATTRDDEGRTPLDYAFCGGFDISLIEYILEKSPKRIPEFWFNGYHPADNSFAITMERAQILEKIMHRTRWFNCEAFHWTKDGLFHVISCLTTCAPYSGTISLILPAEILQHKEEKALDLLQKFVGGNNAVQDLDLALRDGSKLTCRMGDACLESICRGLAVNTSIEFLRLEGFILSKWGVFSDLFKYCTVGRRCLKLANLQWKGSWPEDEEPLIGANCQIVDLTLESCFADSPTLHGLHPLLLELTALRTLHNLTLSKDEEDKYLFKIPPKDKNITAPLIEILNLGLLQALHVCEGFVVDIEPIAEVLKANRSLTTFDVPSSLDLPEKQQYLFEVLKTRNATLRSVPPAKNHSGIQFLLALNKNGRSIVRNEFATKEDLVSLLCHLATSRHADNKELCFQMHHGLLRESPTLWSGEDHEVVPGQPWRLTPHSRGQGTKRNMDGSVR